MHRWAQWQWSQDPRSKNLKKEMIWGHPPCFQTSVLRRVHTSRALLRQWGCIYHGLLRISLGEKDTHLTLQLEKSLVGPGSIATTSEWLGQCAVSSPYPRHRSEFWVGLETCSVSATQLYLLKTYKTLMKYRDCLWKWIKNMYCEMAVNLDENTNYPQILTKILTKALSKVPD